MKVNRQGQVYCFGAITSIQLGLLFALALKLLYTWRNPTNYLWRYCLLGVSGIFACLCTIDGCRRFTSRPAAAARRRT